MPRITEMFAFVAEEKGPDDEGVVGMSVLQWFFPLVGADIARAESLKPIARGIANATGKKIKLVHFTHREDLEEID